VIVYDLPGITDILFRQVKNVLGIDKLIELERFAAHRRRRAAKNSMSSAAAGNKNRSKQGGKDAMTTKNSKWVGLIVCAALLLSAVAASLPAKAADVPMRMAAEPSDVGLMHWWAIDKGIFKKNNLPYAFTQINTAAIGVQAIGADTNDVASPVEPPIVYNVTKGIDVVIVGALAVGQGVFQLVTPKSITKVEQLEGKKVTWMAGTGGEYSWIRYLESKKIPLSKFEFVNLEPSEGVPALINGSVQGAWEWQPWPRKAVSINPKAFHVIAKSSDETYQGYYITVVRKKFAEEHPNEVVAYLKSLNEAAQQINAQPEEAAKLYAKKLRISVAEATLAMRDYKIGVHLNNDILKSLTDVANYLYDHGKVKKKVDWRSLVDPKFLKAVDPKLVKDF
jgi:sulfonate transport system substrate-binding protein